jgi:hypothetical protein
MVEVRNTYRIFICKLEGKRPPPGDPEIDGRNTGGVATK